MAILAYQREDVEYGCRGLFNSKSIPEIIHKILDIRLYSTIPQ